MSTDNAAAKGVVENVGNGGGGEKVVTDKLMKIYGSTAGAGAGEFHVYRHERRREMERLQKLDDDEQAEKSKSEFEAKRLANEKEACDKTNKRAAKRKKRKLQQKEKRQRKKTQVSESTSAEAPALGNEEQFPEPQGGNSSDKVVEEIMLQEKARSQNKFANNGSFLEGVKALKEFVNQS
mmetsp:Transcript_32612/g.51963  ORF Transcript_32612/g.51963 Transcript_32612/m.51963 type:complete len:180 (-) Transcript_32612:4461-5000(-)